MIDLCIKFVPTPSNYIYQLILAVVSVITVGVGGGYIWFLIWEQVLEMV